MRRLLALLLLGGLAAAQEAPAPLKFSEADFAKRRADLARRLNGAFVLDAGPLKSVDDGGRPDMYDFKYLAGLHDDKGILAVAGGKAAIFLSDPSKGAPGFEAVLPLEKFGEWAGRNLPAKLYTKLRAHNLAELKKALPEAEIVGGPLGRELVRMRLSKTPLELRLMRKAADATAKAHLAAMKAVRPGRNEKEIQELIERIFKEEGCPGLGFPTICAAGKNGTVLHYNRNDQEIPKDTLMVIDIGAAIENYVTDITRTLPTSGRFDEEQRRAYECVLDAQKAGEKILRPGVTLREIHEAACAVFEERKFLKWSFGHSRDRGVQHGVGHFVGMYVHDSGDMDAKLRPGMVITIEPGWYDKDRGYGIRIEDIYLVTDAGFDRLSASIPREPDELEKAMAPKREF